MHNTPMLHSWFPYYDDHHYSNVKSFCEHSDSPPAIDMVAVRAHFPLRDPLNSHPLPPREMAFSLSIAASDTG